MTNMLSQDTGPHIRDANASIMVGAYTSLCVGTQQAPKVPQTQIIGDILIQREIRSKEVPMRSRASSQLRTTLKNIRPKVRRGLNTSRNMHPVTNKARLQDLPKSKPGPWYK